MTSNKTNLIHLIVLTSRKVGYKIQTNYTRLTHDIRLMKSIESKIVKNALLSHFLSCFGQSKSSTKQ